MSGVVVEGSDTDKVFDLFVSCLDTLYAMKSFRRDTPGEWRMALPTSEADIDKSLERARILVKYHLASDAALREAADLVDECANKVPPPTE
jgi:hypothetical protein